MHEADDFGTNSTNVVPFGIGTADMKHPAIAQIEAYWEALRGDRQTPLRSEVDPRGIDRALENAFILERIAPGVARFRLAGMHLNDLMGMEVRGMPLTSFITPDGRDRISHALEHVFEQPAKAHILLSGESSFARPSAEAELVLLPLRSDLGDVSRAIGCLVSHGIKGKPPHRFTVEDVKLEELNQRISDAHPVRQFGGASAEPMLREAQKPFVGAKARTDGADDGERDVNIPPYLRLVHTRDE